VVANELGFVKQIGSTPVVNFCSPKKDLGFSGKFDFLLFYNGISGGKIG
jgi:hypothetical protein